MFNLHFSDFNWDLATSSEAEYITPKDLNSISYIEWFSRSIGYYTSVKSINEY